MKTEAEIRERLNSYLDYKKMRAGNGIEINILMKYMITELEWVLAIEEAED